MTRSQIISFAQSITENKLNEQIDFQTLLTQVMQELCGRKRYWWRKKNLTFSTAAGTPSYDLSTVITVPTGAGPFIEEITKIVYQNGSTAVTALAPVSDDEAVANLIISTATGTPASWAVDTGSLTSFQTIRIGPLPTGIFSLRVFFWAMPDRAIDSTDDAVYIIPPPLHRLLVKGMEKNIWRMAFGSEDPKYLTAKAEYDEQVGNLNVKASLDSSKSNFFMNQSDEAIQATR